MFRIFIFIVIAFSASKYVNASDQLAPLNFEKLSTQSLTLPNQTIEELLQLEASSNNVSNKAYYNSLLAKLYYFKGEIDYARIRYQLADSQMPAGQSWIKGYWLLHNSYFSLEKGELDLAVRQTIEAQKIFSLFDDYEMIIKAKAYQGTFLLWQEKYPQSLTVIQEAYELAKQNSAGTRFESYVNEALAAYYGTVGDYSKAILYAEKAKTAMLSRNHWVDTLPVYYSLCLLYFRNDELDKAGQCYAKMSELSSQLKAPRYLFWTPAGQARVAIKNKDYSKAYKLLMQARSYEDIVLTNPAHKIVLRNNLAKSLLALDKADEALKYINESSDLLSIYKSPLNNRYSRQTTRLKAKVLEKLGDHKAAIEALWQLFELNDQANSTSKKLLEQEIRFGFEAKQKELDLKLADEKLIRQALILDKLAKENELRNLYAALGITLLLGVCFFAYKQFKAKQIIQKLANTDPLTQAYNRRYLHSRANALIRFSNRHHLPLSIIMLDIDYFKEVNDQHGHETGDRVLVELSLIISSALKREGEFLARYGGEEFIVVLPGFNCEQAKQQAELFRLAISKKPLTSKAIPITLSCGVAQLDDTTENIERLISVADTNLYQAKNLGRDRVVG